MTSPTIAERGIRHRAELDRGGAYQRRLSVIVASGPDTSHRSPAPPGTRPVEDYETLDQVFDTTIVDPRVALRGRLAQLVARLTGSAWVVAYRTVRTARRADAIIAMGDDVGVPIAAMKVVFRSRTPFVMICPHLQSKKARVLLGRLGLHRGVQRFVPLSSALRDVLVDQLGVAAEKVDTLCNTVDHRFFTSDQSAVVEGRIASAGLTLRDYKTLLRATRGLDVEVKIEANSAWYDQPVNFAAADLHDRVELCNDGTTNGLRDIYASSSIVVVPLREIGEPAGNTTILEGMAMGKAVIATDIKLGGGFICDGETGFLVPPTDVAALRACIIRLLDDAPLRQRIGAAARRAVEERFTRDHFADALATNIELAMSASRSA